MPRDASGTYSRAVAPYVNGTVADAADVNDEMDDFANEVTDSLTASGKKAWGANQSGGGFWVNTLGNTRVYTTTGSANAYIVTTGASLSNLTGRVIFFKASFSNTGACTLNVDGIGAIALKKNGTTDPASGDIVSGNCYAVGFDGTNLQLLTGLGTFVAAQPLDATLTALAALSTAADQYIRATGADTFAMSSVTAAAQSLLGDASVPRLGVAGTWTASQTVGGSTGGWNANNNFPIYSLTDADSGADAKNFIMLLNAGQLTLAYRNDALSVQNDILSVARSGATVGAATWSVTQHLSVNGSNANPTYSWTNDPDCGHYRIGANNIGFALNGVKQVDYATTLIEYTPPVKATTPTSSEVSGTLSLASANSVVVTTAGVTINDGVFSAGHFVMIYNNSAAAVTITQDTGMTLRLHGTATTGNRTLAARGMATLYFVSASEAVVLGDVT